MTTLRTKICYKKMAWFGDRAYRKTGNTKLPCYNCDKLFTSYEHYTGDFGGFTYDHLCSACRKKKIKKYPNNFFLDLMLIVLLLLMIPVVAVISVFFGVIALIQKMFGRGR